MRDVAFLYGLPTTGQVVTGRFDFDDFELLATYALPQDTSQEKVEKRKHAVRFMKLRKMWKDVVLIPDDQDQIDRYTRAFVLELIGCSLFPNSTGDSVPAFYLDLLRIFVLLPFRECTIGVRPHLLRYTETWTLQRWTTRPKSKKFKGSTSASEMDYARNVLLKIRPEHVVWRPYDHMWALMPRYAQVDTSLFIVRIPCIHYWMVMWHYADRVMHQFMLYQTVPPPRPELGGGCRS
ncbi:hypothetical protein LUZ61_006189 [Rhynchospora tenuis]|uniref:Aminotransferase-like plant mobile domain-containing protein n=1 Tax=Rhynchospora tenuis TaxID=198213 RepID=A0AAD5ZQZ7_9POAL|nr:hypothetical protein LUZ61_006189 [Rhynchospora tenuis]